MTDHPIIFSEPMVRALLEGRKTQTRRLAWRDPLPVPDDAADYWRGRGARVSGPDDTDTRLAWLPSPWQRVQPGDRLWVKENYRGPHAYEVNGYKPKDWGNKPSWFMADGEPPADRAYFWWPKARPSIHMPRNLSRLTLTVTEARVQRLQNIDRGDAMAEGCPFPNMAAGPNPRDWFADLWNALHGPSAWKANPEVVALSFTVAQRNIDA